MTFERENAKPIKNPSANVLARELKKLRNYGPSSFATLTADDGSYLQVAGGGVGCLLEKRDAKLGKQFRAWQESPVVPPDFKDGTFLCFSGGEIPLKRVEWFRITQIIEAFIAFNAGQPYPSHIQWRDISEMFQG